MAKMTARTFVTEALASVVVFLVALPLCMGVAIASGVPPVMGLVSGIVGGLIVGYFAGSPLQVSGPAAGLAVIVYEIVTSHGLEMLGPIVVVAGLIQIVAGRLDLGQWFRAVAPAVIYAMLAGIGVLIFASQFHVMIDDVPDPNGLVNVVTIPGAIVKSLAAEGPHAAAAGIGLLTLIILIVWNLARTKLPGGLKKVPAALLAVGAAVAAAAALNLDIAYVSMPANASQLVTFPTLASVQRLAEPAVLGSALALAAIASAEALLCAGAVDKVHDGVRTDFDKELFAQGIGNTVAGLLGALPVTGVIVRSTANVDSGATTKWSAILHGAWLLLAAVAIPFVFAYVPIASLAAILVYIGFKLVDVKAARALLTRGKGELAIYLVTVAVIVATSLLAGLLVGIALSILKLAWSFAHLDVQVSEREEQPGVRDIVLRGSATFVGLPVLAKALEASPIAQEVHIHFEDVDYVDHACFELLSDWRTQYEGKGGTVVLEWNTLAERGVYRARLRNSSPDPDAPPLRTAA